MIGNHPAFLDGPEVISGQSGLWAEFQACLDLGIDPDVQFAKSKESRMLITGGSVASRAIHAMRNYDLEEKREAQAAALRRRGKK